jgi:hypothetical protein
VLCHRHHVTSFNPSADLEAIAARIVRQTQRWIEEHEGPDEPHDALLATYGDAIDPRRPPSERPFVQNSKKLAVQVEGFSLEAGWHVHANDREALGRLCRYGARPPLSAERLCEAPDGRLVVQFKKSLPDGSTEVRLTPKELIRRLSALVPPPGFHMVGFHGLFASRSPWRKKIVPASAPEKDIAASTVPASDESRKAGDFDNFPPFPDRQPRDRYLPWAELMRRTHQIDPLLCRKCGGRLELVALISDPDLAKELLAQWGKKKPHSDRPSLLTLASRSQFRHSCAPRRRPLCGRRRTRLPSSPPRWP